MYATGWTEDDVRTVLDEETEGHFQHAQTVDNRRKKNTPKEADEVIQFKMV